MVALGYFENYFRLKKRLAQIRNKFFYGIACACHLPVDSSLMALNILSFWAKFDAALILFEIKIERHFFSEFLLWTALAFFTDVKGVSFTGKCFGGQPSTNAALFILIVGKFRQSF